MNVETVLEEFATRQGWNEASQVFVLSEFVDKVVEESFPTEQKGRLMSDHERRDAPRIGWRISSHSFKRLRTGKTKLHR